MSERAMLLQLVDEAEGIQPDWQDALGRAGLTGRFLPARPDRRISRRALLVIAAALAVLYAVSAVAADSPKGVVYWLYDRSGETYPLIQAPTLEEWRYADRAGFEHIELEDHIQILATRVHVLHGAVVGHRFEMQVLFTQPHSGRQRRVGRPNGLFVGLHPGGPPEPYHGTNVPGLAGGGAGHPVHGLEPKGEIVHWIGFGTHVPGPIDPAGGGVGPKWLFGPAAPNVRQVDLESDDGTVVRVPTFAGPKDLEVPARFWVAVLRLDHIVNTVVPRDAEGNALEHWHLEIAQ